jgi:hypothetical protein
MTNTPKILARNPEGKRPRMGFRCRKEDNIGLNLIETACQGVY